RRSHRRTNSKPAYEVRPVRSYRKISCRLTRARNSAFGRRTGSGLSSLVELVAWWHRFYHSEGPFLLLQARSGRRFRHIKVSSTISTSTALIRIFSTPEISIWLSPSSHCASAITKCPLSGPLGHSSGHP